MQWGVLGWEERHVQETSTITERSLERLCVWKLLPLAGDSNDNPGHALGENPSGSDRVACVVLVYRKGGNRHNGGLITRKA